jgi:hypothetical protein
VALSQRTIGRISNGHIISGQGHWTVTPSDTAGLAGPNDYCKPSTLCGYGIPVSGKAASVSLPIEEILKEV